MIIQRRADVVVNQQGFKQPVPQGKSAIQMADAWLFGGNNVAVKNDCRHEASPSAILLDWHGIMSESSLHGHPEHMQKEYWHQKWQSSDIGFNQQQPNKLLQRYFPALQLKPGDRVLVPLCGKSVDMIWLAGQGLKLVGVELSPLACEAFFKENRMPFQIKKTDDFIIYSNPDIILLAGDFFKLTQQIIGHIDAIYDRAALIALPADLRQSYTSHLAQFFTEKTRMLLITSTYDQSQMPGPPFSVDEQEVKTLFNPFCTIKRLYEKPINDLPEHLRARGLLAATEMAYEMTGKV